jgi:hypothetical protein
MTAVFGLVVGIVLALILAILLMPARRAGGGGGFLVILLGFLANPRQPPRGLRRREARGSVRWNLGRAGFADLPLVAADLHPEPSRPGADPKWPESATMPVSPGAIIRVRLSASLSRRHTRTEGEARYGNDAQAHRVLGPLRSARE